MIKTIESESNGSFKRWKRLANEPRATKKCQMTLAEGAHLAEVYLKGAPEAVYSIIVSEEANDEARYWADQLMDTTKAQAFEVSRTLYRALSPVEHGIGLMCEVKLPEAQCSLTEYFAQNPNADVLYLDGVQDAGNAGTLIRTALASGIKTICASPQTANLWAPKVLRAGMGAHVGVTIFENVTVEALREAFPGLLLAADARGGEDLFLSEDYTQTSVGWIMGAEGPGVSERALSIVDRKYYIPIEAQCESLNVAAAAAVCLFDTRRRRLAQKP